MSPRASGSAAPGDLPPGAAQRARPARDLRLLPVASAAWAGALASVFIPDAAWAVAATAWACALGTLAFVFWRTRRRRSLRPNRGDDLHPRTARPGSIRGSGSSPRLWTARRSLPTRGALVAVACAAVGLVAAHVAFAQPPREAALRTLEGDVEELLVEVTTKLERTPSGVRFDGSVRTTAGEAPVSVVWRGGERTATLDLGARVAVKGHADPAGRGEAAVVVVFADAVDPRAPPRHLFAVASDLRRGFVDDVIAGLPAPGAGLLPGLSVGETSEVTPDLDATMKITSLSHLTAVSGSNCALVVGIAFGLAALCGAGRRTRVVVALVVLAGFVLLVTPEASVIRAATMSAVAMLALLLGRRGAGVAVLSLAVTALLIADPWLATSYGFLLSASATGALLLLAEPLARGLARWMPMPVSLGFAVPLAAQLVCGPIIVLFAPEVALYGVAANMIAGPAAPAATVLGLLACVAQPIPPLALGLATLAWLPSAWIAHTAETFAALPSAQLVWHEGWVGFALLAAVGALVVIAITGIPARRAPPTGSRTRGALGIAIHRAAVAAVAIALGTAVGSVALGGIAAPLTAPDDWSIALCDVGQGDAVLLRSAGQVALVDTGPDAAALDQCLTRLDVDVIDVAFLTHFDADHVSGVPALAGRVEAIIHGPAEHPSDLATSRAVAGDVREGRTGMSGTIGRARWRILWPAPNTRAFPPGNDTSLVLEFDGPRLPRTLLLGDLGEDAQRLLVGSGVVDGAYDAVKVAHHGSRDQFSGLYSRIRPRIALIGVGENDYGHPHPDLIAVLQRAGATIARSDTDGLVLVSAPDGLAVWREFG